MKEKKILLVYYKLFKPGGVAKVMTNLANELVNEGYEIEILLMTRNTETFYALDPSIELHYVDMFSHWAWRICEFNAKFLHFIPKIHNINSYISHIGVFLLLRSWLNQNHHHYDKIISCWYKLSKIISFLPKISKKTYAWEHIAHTVGGIFWNKILKNRYQYIAGVITTNKAGENFNKAINPNTKTIYNMMDNQCEKQPFIPAEQKENIISMVARLDAEKNISEFLEIIKEVAIPENWSVKIIGDGYQKQRLWEKAKNENIRVEFLGAQNIQEVYQLLSLSKINCLSSTAEALPTILIQAMFFSNTLVSYDCNYGPADIINEKNGFLIPLHDKESYVSKLKMLIENEFLLNKKMILSYQESKNWKKNKILQKWKELL